MMRLFILLILTFVLGAGFTARAQISCTVDTVRFGVISEEAGEKKVTVYVRNDSDTPLSLNRVRPTCGCTAADYYKETFEPGDSAWIELTYDPSMRPGRFEKGVKVHPSKGEMIRIPIAGVVAAKPETVEQMFPSEGGLIRLTERTVMTLQPLASSERSLFIDVYNYNDSPVYTLVTDNSEAVETQVFPPVIPPYEKATIGIYIIPGREERSGKLEYTLNLHTSFTPDGLSDAPSVELKAFAEKNY